jgi:hypothetical protein
MLVFRVPLVRVLRIRTCTSEMTTVLFCVVILLFIYSQSSTRDADDVSYPRRSLLCTKITRCGAQPSSFLVEPFAVANHNHGWC